MEERTAIKFCVKLNKTATEMFEMLKSAYGEVCLSRTSVFEWHKRFKNSSESENAKIGGEKKMLTAFLVLKISFIMNLCSKNRL
jgi:hypothetical protein